MTSTDRIHYMDNLRALAMLLGIFFHAALAYSPLMANLWLAANPEQSQAMDMFAWFTHLFRMPLFFLIAGFFAQFLLERRGVKAFVVHRFKRIALPFVIFLPIVTICILMMIGWAIETLEQPSPMLAIIKMMQANPNAEPPPISTMHLWFLFNLMLFCLVAALLHFLGWLQHPALLKCINPVTLVCLLPVLMAPALSTQSIPHPAAERIYPELWSFGFYGVFFLAGMLIYQKQEVIESFKPWALPLLVVSVVLYAYLYSQLPATVSLMDAMQKPAWSWGHLGMALIESAIAVYMSIVCLVYGARLLAKQNPVYRYIADASYWIYIIHLPLVFYLQFLLMNSGWNAWLQFAFVSLVTLLIGFISYALLVRWTPIGLLLNGKRVPLKDN